MEFWRGKKVLVTGANGFIGSWLTKRLIGKGAEVFTITRDINKYSNLRVFGIKEKVNVVEGDIVNYELVSKVLRKYEIDTCFHLAAQSVAHIAEKSILSTFESNIKGTWVLLEACKNFGVERVIIASSDKAYGMQKELPNYEEQALLGRNPYSVSKVCADVLAQSYACTFNLPVAIVRSANTYGLGDLNLSRLVPGTIVSVLKGEVPIIRSDGTPERDYIYVEDLVNGYLLIAENLDRQDVRGEAFNFGSGKPTSVLDLFNMIIKLAGKDVIPNVIGEAKNEIDRQYLSIAKAGRVLGWRPKWGLDEGLRETVKWYRENLVSLDR